MKFLIAIYKCKKLTEDRISQAAYGASTRIAFLMLAGQEASQPRTAGSFSAITTKVYAGTTVI